MNPQTLKVFTFFTFSISPIMYYLYQSAKKLINLLRHQRSLLSTNPPYRTGLLCQPSQAIQLHQTQDIINQLSNITFSTPETIFYRIPALMKLKTKNELILIHRNVNIMIEDKLYQKNTKSVLYEQDLYNYIYPIAYLIRPFFKGLKVGHQETIYTVLEQEVVVIGEVLDNSIRNPIALVSSLEVYLGWLKAQIIWKWASCFCWSMALIWMLVWGGARFWRQWQFRHRREGGQQVESVVVDEFTCGKCRTGLRSRVCMPCAHLALCEKCERVFDCPVCGKQVLSLIELFIP